MDSIAADELRRGEVIPCVYACDTTRITFI